MTPKEKAEELFNKFYVEVLDRDGTSSMHGVEAKQCALIAVDEILKTPFGNGYWIEVKLEIENL